MIKYNLKLVLLNSNAGLIKICLEEQCYEKKQEDSAKSDNIMAKDLND